MVSMQGSFIAVSGAAGRIGHAVVKKLLADGHNVLGLESDRSRLDEAFPSDVDRFIGLHADVREPQALSQALSIAEEKFGQITGAVHAAYPRSDDWGALFEDVTPESLKDNLFGQLGGTILFSREITARMKSAGGGSLALVSSIQGVRAPRFDHYEGLSMSSPAEYTAIKAGVIAFTGWLAKYLAGTNVRVNCVSPGGIDADQPKAFKDRYREDCLTKGLLDPEDVVGAISFLLSEDSRFISGQNIVVDDGWSL